jgi:hypothetical protein
MLVWHIETQASRASLSFASLPWPSDMSVTGFMFQEG